MTRCRVRFLILAVLAITMLSSPVSAQQERKRARAEAGDAKEQNDLAVMYHNGTGGLPQADSEAVRWFRLAAEQGLAEGQTNLGFMYQNGFGGLPQDDTEAVRWYRLAAEQGDANAKQNLQFMYANGRGVPDEINDATEAEAAQQIRATLLTQRMVARVTFPASNNGIDLWVNGSWNPSDVTRRIKDDGVGIEIGDLAVVTDVKLKGKHIEIHLNGGGYGTALDIFTTTTSDFGNRTGKQAGGSRINLRFDRDIRRGDFDPGQLAAWLSPVVDASVLLGQAAVRELPDELRAAAERGEIRVGMSKAVIFAVRGEPTDRSVNVDVDPPVEKWIYLTNATTTVIVTFIRGKVSKIDEI